MAALVTPAARDQVSVKDADHFEFCGEACLASAFHLDTESVAGWLRQHEGGEPAVHNGTSVRALVNFCRGRGVAADVMHRAAVDYVARAAARGHYSLVLVWSDHHGNPIPRAQSTTLHPGGIGHWLLGYGTAGTRVQVMQPWGGRLLAYDLARGEDQMLGIEIKTSVEAQIPALARTRVYRVKAGDTLTAIARREHVMLRQLVAANPQIKDLNRVRPGDRIAVPS